LVKRLRRMHPESRWYVLERLVEKCMYMPDDRGGWAFIQRLNKTFSDKAEREMGETRPRISVLEKRVSLLSRLRERYDLF